MSNQNNKVISNEEINLVELAVLIWSKKIFIIKLTTIFVILGLIIAFTSSVEYETSCKLLPESQEGTPDLGGLGGLAGLAGFDLSGITSSGGMSPELYPEIVNSSPFLDQIINTPVYFENIDSTVSSFNYFKEVERPSLLGLIAEYTIGLPGKLKETLSNNNEVEIEDYNMIRYSKEDWQIIEKFQERLSISIESSTGTVKISCEMPDPVATAKILNLLVLELTRKVTEYKIEKAKVNLEFVEERFNEVKEEYELKQEALARFSDRNRNVTNSIVQTEYERLQNELDISFEVYKGLASQLEQVRIRVKEETPIFTVLEPVKVPEDKSKPERLIILIVSLMLGVMISIGLIIIRERVKK